MLFRFVNTLVLPMLMLYKKRTQSYVENKIYTTQKGVNDILLRSIYELKLNRFNMPIFLGIPTQYAMYMKMMAIEWQSALFYYCQQHQKHLVQLSVYDMKHFIKWLNLEQSNERIQAINSYVLFLKELGIGDVNNQLAEQTLFEKLYYQLVAKCSENCKNKRVILQQKQIIKQEGKTSEQIRLWQ